MRKLRVIGLVVAVVALVTLGNPSVTGAATPTLVARGSSWKYLDNGSDQGTAWRAPTFNDGAWKAGPAELGYGDGDEKTVVGFGPNANHKYKTTYFRHTFGVTDRTSISGLKVEIRRDDGAAVYLNGTEVVRSNLPGGTLNYLTDASSITSSETTFYAFDVPPSLLVNGNNTIAVEVHQYGWASSDISMDLGLIGTTTAGGCTTLGAPTTLGHIADAAVIESSGLAAGVRSPGVWYTHNDSGDTARFFAMGRDGRSFGRFALAGAGAVDWEDMAIGPGPVAGQSYVYLGDIGGPRRAVTVYRIPEPAVSTSTTTTSTTTLTGVARFDVTYPGGISYDAETLLVDPIGGAVHIVTKATSGVSEIFRFTAGATSGSPALSHVGTLRVPGPGSLQATGGSISRDGSVVTIRTYDHLLRWQRASGSTLVATLANAPCVDALAYQPQGESVAFSTDGHSLLETSEGSHSAITSYPLP